MTHVKKHASKALKTSNEVPLILFGAALFVATLVSAEIFGRPMTRAANRERPAVTRVERGERVRAAAPSTAGADKWDCGAKNLKMQRTGR